MSDNAEQLNELFERASVILMAVRGLKEESTLNVSNRGNTLSLEDHNISAADTELYRTEDDGFLTVAFCNVEFLSSDSSSAIEQKKVEAMCAFLIAVKSSPQKIAEALEQWEQDVVKLAHEHL